MVAVCGLLCDLCQVATGRVQAAAELGLWQGPSQKDQDCTPGGQLWSEPEHNLEPHLKMTHPKGRLGQHQSPAIVNPAP